MFTPKNNMQAAQMQGVLNRSLAPNTMAHYALKQPEVQIVRVKGSKNRQTISLHGMESKFKELGDAYGASSNDVYYQLKSFRCPRGFHNINGTDRIAIYVENLQLTKMYEPSTKMPEWLQTTNQVRWDKFSSSNAAQSFPVYISLSPTSSTLDDKSYYMSPPEIVSTLNTNLKTLLSWMATPNSTTVPQQNGVLSMVENDTDMRLLYIVYYRFFALMQHSTFVYQQESGRIQLMMSGTLGLQSIYYPPEYDLIISRQTPQNCKKIYGFRGFGYYGAVADSYFDTTPSTPAAFGAYSICDAALSIGTDPTASETDKQRIAIIFGFQAIFDTTITFPVDSTITTTPATLSSTITQMIQMRQANYFSFFLTSPQVCLDLWQSGMVFPELKMRGANIHASLQGFAYMNSLYQHEMNELQYDQFHICSSLKSTVVDATGKRTDLLSVATVQDTGTAYFEYRSANVRDYDGRDSLSSLKNFYLEVRDVNGEAIDFSQVGDYEVEIAIWIAPQDPKLYAF